MRNRLVTLVLLVAMLTGCHGYQVGTEGLYNREIKTVFVPMVQADSYRKALGERLTEAVCKKITTRTPYDLTGPDRADSVLVIRLVSDGQYVSALNKYNDTRQKTLNWCVLVRWQDSRGYVLGETAPIPLATEVVTTGAEAWLVPEMGQSGATTQQEIIEKLADQIVGLMEEKW
ncbi:MAG: LPS assembly lipoprotein LptE [Planctomycetia bacterium]|nr:LPS assembly lipoprotein LptE [Planctomycetia bacterium]